MLNTDMELAFDIDFNNTSGTSCVINHNSGPPEARGCPTASTYGLVRKYADVSASKL